MADGHAQPENSGGLMTLPDWLSPTVEAETWQSLANQIQPSQGPYSGGFKPGTTAGDAKNPNNSQWIRRISLVVYKPGSTTPATSAANSTVTPSQASAGPGTIGIGGASVVPLTRAARADSGSVSGSKGTSAGGAVAGDKQQQAQPGIELGALRVEFNVNKATNQSPNLLDAKVYNLSKETMNKINLFTRVQLSAGYWYGDFGVVFDGTVVQYRRARESPTDTYLEILGGDEDSTQGAFTFKRFEIGTKESTVVQALVKDTGLPAGYVSNKIGSEKLLRPLTLAGPTMQYLREMGQKYGANIYADNGKLFLVSQDEYRPGDAVVLSPKTGLVGIPELTPQGLQVRCLLNPKIQLGGKIKIDPELISGIPYYPGQANTQMTGFTPGEGQKSAFGPIGKAASIPEIVSASGLYKVMMLEITGDTRGHPWYCDMICLATDASGAVHAGTSASIFNRAASRAKTAP
jgi:hypothetical protein